MVGSPLRIGGLVVAGLMVLLAQALPGRAQITGGDKGEPPPPLPMERQLPVALALDAASAALDSCTQQGYRVTVAVVGRDGQVTAHLRGDGAGPHTIESSRQKAFTAVSLRRSTAEYDAISRANPANQGLRELPGVLLLAGGLPIAVENDVVGAIGVAGAPGGNLDEACAQAGIDRITDRLK